GQFDGTITWHYFYFVDNEIHHRAQAYVYLRALGIEPPPFWDRH
ncbi:MAG TPA: DinB family protein, partial [Cyclobacteriaceae bacterium]|nr:DinB family protein [Cyclobacteriaceae bacterium]